jgi:hypothetical protein
MRQVSDGFLLNMAEVFGALVGLFLVGATSPTAMTVSASSTKLMRR